MTQDRSTPTDARVVFDHRGAPVERTSWRTFAVLAHTLSGSARIVGRGGAGRLRPEHVDRVLRRWCAHTFRLSRTTLVGHGLGNVAPGQPYVVLSNHQSLLDIPALSAAFPGRLRFVAKQELRGVPVFGRAIELAGGVFVDRGDRARAIEQLAAARERLAEGVSVWVAAEGTRARDGRLGPFKKGGFHVALALGVPILPAWVQGTLAVIPPDQWASVTGGRVDVRFGAPIPTAGLGRDELGALMARTRAAIEALAVAT